MISASPLQKTEPAMPRVQGKRISPISSPCFTREYSSFVSASYRNSELRSAFRVVLTTSIRRGNSTSRERLSQTRLAMSATAAVRRACSASCANNLLFPQSSSPRSKSSISALLNGRSMIVRKVSGPISMEIPAPPLKRTASPQRIRHPGRTALACLGLCPARSGANLRTVLQSHSPTPVIIPAPALRRPRPPRSGTGHTLDLRYGEWRCAPYQTRSLTWIAKAPSKRSLIVGMSPKFAPSRLPSTDSMGNGATNHAPCR